MRDAIRTQLKTVIIKALRFEDLTPDQIPDDQPLLTGDLAIDSVDILQLILEIERVFSIKLVSGEFDRSQWKTVDTLAAAIEARIRDGASRP